MKKLYTVFIIILIFTIKQATAFTINLDSIDANCIGNGQIIVNIDSTQTVAELEITVYKSPDFTNPYLSPYTIFPNATSLSDTIPALLGGYTYLIEIKETINGVINDVQSASIYINDTYEPIIYSYTTFDDDCNGIYVISTTEKLLKM